MIGTQDYGVRYRSGTDTGSQGVRVFAPPREALDSAPPVILWSHPQGQTSAISQSYWLYPLVHACVQEGWIFAATDQHGSNSSGSPAATGDLATLRSYVDATVRPTGPVILAGGSMGGLATANAVSHNAVADIVGAYVIDGVFDLRAFYTDAAYKATVVAGYALTDSTLTAATSVAATSLPTTGNYPTVGTLLLVGNGTANVEIVTTTAPSTGTSVAVTALTKTHASGDGVSDYPTKTATHDPRQAAANLFTGIPWRFSASTTDTTVPMATHTTPFAAKIAAAPEAGVVSHYGGHLAAFAQQPRDFVAFARRCLSA